MRRLVLSLLALALLPIFRVPASAQNVQYAGRPAHAACRDKSDVGQGHPRQRGNDACALYTSLSSGTEGRGEDRARSPTDRRASSARPAQTGGAHGHPHLVFLHGGAYVRGSRNVNAEVYGHVATYFGPQGMRGVNGTHRLEPAAQSPAATCRGRLGLPKWRERGMPGRTEVIRTASI